jgi:hypothetical protein
MLPIFDIWIYALYNDDLFKKANSSKNWKELLRVAHTFLFVDFDIDENITEKGNWLQISPVCTPQ